MEASDFLTVYLDQKKHGLDGSIYHKTQVEPAYNSNRIEGSRLTENQTRMIFDRKHFSGDASLDDILEAKTASPPLITCLTMPMRLWASPISSRFIGY